MSSPAIITENTTPRKLQRANEAGGAGRIAAPGPLFDEFWREGEIALLFGPAGAGKSLLAVGLAEAIARGRPMAGLEMPARPQRVLYVDLVLSDEQFAYRYSCEAARNGRRRYKFSERLYRDRPPEGARMADWVRATVMAEKTRVVIIDDLAVISQSDDGTRETLELVRDLRRMTRELGISVLVLADSQLPVFDRCVAERDLRRTRVLCGYADSVFALSTDTNAERSLVQTRTQGELVWTNRRPARFVLMPRDNGLVEFAFVEEHLTAEERNLICRIKLLHDAGRPYRSIAAALKMSKSKVARLHAKWRPEFEPYKHENSGRLAVGSGQSSDTDDDDTDFDEGFIPDADRYGIPLLPSGSASSPPCLGGVEVPTAFGGTYGVVVQTESDPHLTTIPPRNLENFNPHNKPFLAALRRRTIHDLDLGYDAAGNVIYIESLDEHTRKPIIWYTQDRTGLLRRHERKGFSIQVEAVGRTEYV